MKLVEIKDMRPGQVWKAFCNLFVIETAEGYINNEYQSGRVAMYERGQRVLFGIKHAPDFFVDKKLIGKLGFTHEIKDNRLVEIPRPKIEVDDIVKIFDEAIGCICNLNKENALIYFSGQNDFDDTDNPLELHPLDDLKKIGILSVTHEFINERSVK